MKDYSVFIYQNNKEHLEYHNLTRMSAFETALSFLYNCNDGSLNPKIKVVIQRPKIGVIFSGINP